MDFDGSIGTESESVFQTDYYDNGCADIRRHRERSPLSGSRH